MKYLFIGVVIFFSSFSAAANEPVCHQNGSDPYCQYTGKVSNIYVNSGNLILMYFDTSLDTTTAQEIGFNTSKNNAAAIKISDNEGFAKFFYSTALAAQSSKRDVTIQMRGNVGSYLKIDRIWLAE